MYYARPMSAADDKTVELMLGKYEKSHKIFEELRDRCAGLITTLLGQKGIEVHSVTSRVKGKKKLAEKLTRVGRSYKRLEDISDIVGIRVITHFESEIDEIGSLVEKEFKVDPL